MYLDFTFPGEPKAVQSFRFTRTGRKYQPKAVTDWKSFIRLAAQDQLPEDFVPLDEPLAVEAYFYFTLPKQLKKADKELLANMGFLWKTSRPDLADNLCKGLFDAMTGIVWRDDSRIVSLTSNKAYAVKPEIHFIVRTLQKSPETGLGRDLLGFMRESS